MTTTNPSFDPAEFGLPDASQLAKWANELYAAPPTPSADFGIPHSAATHNPVKPIPEAELSLIGRHSLEPSGLPLEAELEESLTQYVNESAKKTPDSETALDFNIPDSAATHVPARSIPASEQPLIGRQPLQPSGLPLEAELNKKLERHLKETAKSPYGTSGLNFGIPGSAATGRDRNIDSRELALEQLLRKNGEQAQLSEIKQLYARHASLSGKPPIDPRAHTSFYFLKEIPEVGKAADTFSLASAHPPFDVFRFRKDFPILNERVNGRPLVWFDNAATTQKPQVVIDRLSEFYQHENSNIHRAAHELAARATDAYENARDIVARFLNASSPNEIVFLRGSTEAINLVAQSYGRQHIGKGDEIVISWLEHHANIVPWQQLCQETGAILRVIPVDDSGQIVLSEYQKLLNANTKLVSFTHVSNALGTITPAQEIIELAQQVGAKVLLDAAQSVSHLSVDVQQLNCDWLVFSGHKIFGPTGIGVLYGKEELLNSMEPWQGGGNMIEDVTFEKTIYQASPARFEAGTGNIADAVGLGAALEYLEGIGISNVARYEHELLDYATELLKCIPGLRQIGTAKDKTSVLSFILKGHNPEDVGKALNQEGIAVRSGHHCAQPILRRFGLEATVRPSLAFYNTFAEVDLLAATLRHLQSSKTFFG